jgi:hypothetical protein
VGRISRPQLDRIPIELVETFPKPENQGVSSDMATLISEFGLLYGLREPLREELWDRTTSILERSNVTKG